jgi:exodeoxyribonuclease VII large subunit
MSKKKDFITVTCLNNTIRDLLKENISEILKVKGEVSNLKLSNGNTFFTLKDKDSAISVVSWGNTFDITNGDDIFVSGKITTYGKQGTYNIQIFKVEKNGIGNIFETYEKLKKVFEKEGLFSKKRKFPLTINKIGIVSAYEGAALQDILYVLKANAFSGEVFVKNCYAQGKYCSQSVSNGIEYFNNMKNKVDLILISRGGGSVEDLMGYSAESVIRAIYNSNIFTISAVGHEIDTMLSDYAADHRSPTPTRAAEAPARATPTFKMPFQTQAPSEVAPDVVQSEIPAQAQVVAPNREQQVPYSDQSISYANRGDSGQSTGEGGGEKGKGEGKRGKGEKGPISYSPAGEEEKVKTNIDLRGGVGLQRTSSQEFGDFDKAVLMQIDKSGSPEQVTGTFYRRNRNMTPTLSTEQFTLKNKIKALIEHGRLKD